MGFWYNAFRRMLAESVKPSLEITIPPSLGGSWAPVNTTFNPSSSQVLVQYSISSTAPMNWWRHHTPDFAVLILFFFALFFALLVRRVLRRPQLFDHIYCRVCNYDLTPAPAVSDHSSLIDSPARCSLCPECGASTLKRTPAKGLPAFRRLFPLIGLSIPCLLIPLLILSSRLEFKNSGNTAWPFTALDQVKWWPLARPSILPYQARHFDTYSLPAARQVSSTIINHDSWNGRLTRDLAHYAYSRFSPETGWENQAIIFDPAAGRERSYNMGDSGTGFSAFHGYTPDEKEAVYTLISLVGPDSICTARILCIDVETLKVREVAQLNVTPQSTGPNNWQLPTLSAAVCNSPPRWVFLIVSGPDAGLLHYGSTKTETPGETKLSRSLSAGPYSLTQLSYSSAGVLLIDDSCDVNLTTGIVSARPPAPSPVPATIYANQMLLYSGPTLKLVAPIDSKTTMPITSPVFSPDGRWVAITVSVSSPTQPPISKCLIFDLSGVTPVPPETPH